MFDKLFKLALLAILVTSLLIAKQASDNGRYTARPDGDNLLITDTRTGDVLVTNAAGTNRFERATQTWTTGGHSFNPSAGKDSAGQNRAAD
jgi:hypothetical protein